MCLAPKMPKPPEPTPPPPSPVMTGTQPTTIKAGTSRRGAIQQASRGTSNLTIPLGNMPTGASMTNLSIGSK